ncbi:MAG TPA: type II toxin-antitoxin system VapC family toxin [Longimicrobiales bacterium]
MIVKLLVPEPERDAAIGAWDRASSIYASRLCYTEVRAALSRARRAGRIAPGPARLAHARLDARWEEVQVIELTDVVARLAGDVAERHALRAGDAVHLASALILQDPEVAVATWDQRLGEAAHDAGLPVIPALG